MEYAALGNTELMVSRIAFGCWAIGGHGYGRVDDRESIASIRSALDLGVNFFDTADIYGFGHSERILSEALGPHRRETIIATKFGVCWDDAGKTFRDSSPKRAEAALEASLRRLGLDSIPLYQIHWHDGVTPVGDTIEALLRFQEAGKIQHFGCSNFSLDLVEKANEIARPASIQAHLSVVDKQNEKLLKECFKESIGTLAYGVLGRGLLSGKYDRTSRFCEKDTRAVDANFQGEGLVRNMRVAGRLKEMGRDYGKSPAQVAMRWILDTPFITSAIVGIKSGAQALENVGALGWNLNPLHYASLSDSAKV